jgi:hypothetical protein
LQLEASAGERNAGVCVKQQLFSSKIQGVGWCDNEASVVAVVSSATGYDPPLKNELDAKPTIILSACCSILDYWYACLGAEKRIFFLEWSMGEAASLAFISRKGALIRERL